MNLMNRIHGRFIQNHKAIQKKGSYYRRSLITVLIAALLPISLIGIINYYVGTRQVKAEVSRTHAFQLKQAYNDIDGQLVQLESIASEWAFNPLFSSDLKDIDLGIRFDRFYEVLGGIRVLQQSSPIIHEVRLYIDNSFGDVVITYDGGLKKVSDPKEVEQYQEYLDDNRSYFWTNSEGLNNKAESLSMRLVRKVPGNIGNPYGELVFFLDNKTFNKSISQLNLSNEGAAFILDGAGEWVTSGRDRNKGVTPFDEVLKNEVIKRNEPSGTFSFKYKKADYVVSFETLSQNGWKFIVASPLSRLMAPVELTARLVIISCIIVLLLSVIVAVFASSRIYRPVGRLLGLLDEDMGDDGKISSRDEISYIEERWKNLSRESTKLKTKLEQNKDSLKKGFLLQLIQGHLYFLSGEELKEQFRQYWWEPDNSIFSIFIIRIIGYNAKENGFRKGDEQLVTFAAANITEEMVKQSVNDASVINFHDLSLAVLLSFPRDKKKEDIKAGIFHLSDNITKALTNFMNVNVVVAVGRLTNNLSDVSKIMDEARQALRYRDISRNGEIIDMESLLPPGKTKLNYLCSMEKNILDVLRIGMEEETMVEISKFIQKMKSTGAKELTFKQSIFQLLGSILHLIIKSGLNTEELYPGVDLYEELVKINDPEQIYEWFKTRIVVPYVNEISRAREDDEEQSIKKVMEIINENYNKPPISLEFCADSVGMTANNLSIKFKSHTGVNFIDYLTGLRLEAAKELLKSSSMAVNEIAEKVGYQPTYFVRIFKKVEGITPGQYRENCS